MIYACTIFPTFKLIKGIGKTSILAYYGSEWVAKNYRDHLRLETGEVLACSITKRNLSIVIPLIVSCEKSTMEVEVDGAV